MNTRLDGLIAAASFSPSALEAPSAWVGHLPFGAWLVREAAPRTLVELGTHSGNSYFSFCQSVAEAGLETRCYAVDTWKGDAHAGAYDEQVFARVQAHNSRHYSTFSTLLRTTFDEAVRYFSDESVDLLHIDGLHTYEAVSHDFETWLPKLAPGAVVLFHDTNVRERDFGVWRFWEELRSRYPQTLEFSHSHGLGILRLNNAPEDHRLEWLAHDVNDQHVLKSYFAALGSLQLHRYQALEQERLTAELRLNASKLVVEVASLGERANHLGLEVVERDAQITNLAQAAAQRESRVAELEKQTVKMGLEIASKTHEITSLTQSAVERESRLAELHKHGAQLGLEIANRDAEITSLNKTVRDGESLIGELQQRATSLDVELAARDSRITNLELTIRNNESLIADLQKRADNLSRDLAARDHEISTLTQAGDEHESRRIRLQNRVAEQESCLDELRRRVSNLDGEIEGLSETIRAIRNSNSWRITAPLRRVAILVRGG
jgi:peptidoglycan hydrolase CwlO-like protein